MHRPLFSRLLRTQVCQAFRQCRIRALQGGPLFNVGLNRYQDRIPRGFEARQLSPRLLDRRFQL